MPLSDPRCETVRIARLFSMRQRYQAGYTEAALLRKFINFFPPETCSFRVQPRTRFIKYMELLRIPYA
jgi:hypothetical protein